MDFIALSKRERSFPALFDVSGIGAIISTCTWPARRAFQVPARSSRKQSDHPWSAVPHPGRFPLAMIFLDVCHFDRLDIGRIGHLTGRS